MRGPRGRQDDRLDPGDALLALDKLATPIAPFDGTDCTIVLGPPISYQDRFDAMLLVHAQRLSARLLTRDRKLAAHWVALIA